MSTPLLHLDGVTAHLGGTEIVTDVDVRVAPGEVAGLLGPNGSGKSTLLRCAYRVLRPTTGTVRVEGDDIWSLGARQAARRVAVVVQESTPDLDLAVWEVVVLGRAPHKGLLDRETGADHAIVDAAMARVGVDHLAERGYASLSGGEKQRVLLARALTQEPRLLILDEPTNHLDVHYQLAILELVRDLGLGTLAALHDLNLAATYCDTVHLIQAGRIVASGPPAEVLTPVLVAEVFSVRADVLTHPTTGAPHLALSPTDPRTR
jgi:iron complex transport system ATP-binding protein